MLPTKNFQGVKFFLRNAAKEFSFTEGTLILSHWELLFYSKDGKLDLTETYNSVALMEKRKDQSNIFVEFFFKNFKNWIIALPDEATLEEFSKWWSQFTAPKGGGGLEDNVPAFNHNVMPYEIEEEGWDTYHAERDLQRLFMLIDDKDNMWRITDINRDYTVCESYPALTALPKNFDETTLRAAAEHRDLCRFPGFSWIHPTKHTVIVRCSQPLSGRLGNIRNEEDEKLIEEIFQTNPKKPISVNKIIDARPFSNAVANRYKGAGFETKEFYQGCDIEFMDIENIHTMRQSLDKVRRLVRSLSTNDTSSIWLSRLEATGWLGHIHLCLKATVRIAKALGNGVSVLVHCSHGWDRTAQLSALAQIILDPHYRTLRGFEMLVEKEWVSFGHRIRDRAGHLPATEENDEESPIFPQFLDCVYQMMVQFPTQFGFNEQFLIAILDGFYDCRCGTFLSNSEKEKKELKLREKTLSLWTVLNHAKNIGKYQNPLYDPLQILPFLPISATPNRIVFWSTLYERSESLLSPPPSYVAAQRVLTLKDLMQHAEAKASHAKRTIDELTSELKGKDEIINFLLQKSGLTLESVQRQLDASSGGSTTTSNSEKQ